MSCKCFFFFLWCMLAEETPVYRRVRFGESWVWRSIHLSSRYDQQRLFLVVEWVSVPLRRHMVFPSRIGREGVLHNRNGHCWMRQNCSLALAILFSGLHGPYFLPEVFVELLDIWIYFVLFSIFIFINLHTYYLFEIHKETVGKVKGTRRSKKGYNCFL